ncbi:hypothetical protein [Nannocystis pusilla]
MLPPSIVLPTTDSNSASNCAVGSHAIGTSPGPVAPAHATSESWSNSE